MKILTFLISLFIFCAESDVKISEIVTHSDEPYYDFIELWNDGDENVDISGWFLSDRVSELTQVPIPRGTVLKPNEYKSMNVLDLGGIRLDKKGTNIYLVNPKREIVEKVSLDSSINHMAYALWTASDGDQDMALSFVAEEMPPRYPIVGPFVISEIQFWDNTAGGQSYVKITCTRGIDNFRKTDRSTMSLRKSEAIGIGYELRFEEHRNLIVPSPKSCKGKCKGEKTPAAFSIPITTKLAQGESIYIVSGNPSSFANKYNVPRDKIFGPYKGTMGKKGERIALYGYEGHPNPVHLYFVEKIGYKARAPWPVAEKNAPVFAIERHSLDTYGNDPRNWKLKNTEIPCNKELGGASCPPIDKCTIARCSSGGFCRYHALVCNHPNFNECYPNEICKSPRKYGYDTCTITPEIFGHGIDDISPFGVYRSSSGRFKMYWEEMCRTMAIDCQLSDWSRWGPCRCGETQQRTRTVAVPPTNGGVPCPATNAFTESRPCACRSEEDEEDYKALVEEVQAIGETTPDSVASQSNAVPGWAVGLYVLGAFTLFALIALVIVLRKMSSQL